MLHDYETHEFKHTNTAIQTHTRTDIKHKHRKTNTITKYKHKHTTVNTQTH